MKKEEKVKTSEADTTAIARNAALAAADEIDENVFVFYLETVGLLPIIADGGKSVYFVSAVSGKKMSIPAPCVIDARGETSFAVSCALTPLENNVYLLTVTVDPAWFASEKRTFPVTVLPFV